MRVTPGAWLQARKREVAEKQKLLDDLKAGRVPKVDKQLELEEEAEEAPVLQFEVPRHKVKLMIGAGGERIKQIQRRTKTRIQVRGLRQQLVNAVWGGAVRLLACNAWRRALDKYVSTSPDATNTTDAIWWPDCLSRGLELADLARNVTGPSAA